MHGGLVAGHSSHAVGKSWRFREKPEIVTLTARPNRVPFILGPIQRLPETRTPVRRRTLNDHIIGVGIGCFQFECSAAVTERPCVSGISELQMIAYLNRAGRAVEIAEPPGAVMARFRGDRGAALLTGRCRLGPMKAPGTGETGCGYLPEPLTALAPQQTVAPASTKQSSGGSSAPAPWRPLPGVSS